MGEIKLKPLADRVLIEPIATETKTSGGIYIPDTVREKPQKGIVIAVGTGTKDEEMKVKNGDVVIYSKYAGNEITINNKEFLIMKQSDILAVIED